MNGRHLMRTLSLFLFACVLTPAVYARDLPKDGNGLLDACNALVESDDNQSSITSLSSDKFTERMGQFNWCAGYLQGTEDVYELNFINLGIFGMAGLKFEGPEKLTQYAVESFRGPCFPDKAPILQLARVLVKWLREHPEKLHELKSTLTTEAFKESFPCKQTPPKEVAKPTTPAKP
jgi:Rap1a immunity proteins